MSTDTVRAHDHHAEGAHDEPAHGTLKGYLTGFGLSVVLTAIPFWIVMSGAIADRTAAALVVLAFAFVQIVVHMIYFLHMNRSEEHTSELQSLMRISYAVFCLKQKKNN